MILTDLVKRALFGGALATASVGAGAVTVSVPAVAEAKELEELTAANFSQKVYHNPKPVVVLFYEAGDGAPLRGESTVDYSRRMKQVVEALADKYNRQVAFFKVALDHNTLSREAYQRVFGVPDTSPLTVMYGRFDVLTGQQSPHNFRIDIWKGGPVADEWVENWKKIGDGWLKCNLVGSCVSKDFAYRFENSAEIHKLYK